MSENPNPIEIVRTLIELSDTTITHVASVVGIQPSNVGNWLKGKSPILSHKVIANLLAVLSYNMDERVLDPSRVHVWTVMPGNLSLLKRAIDLFFDEPVTMTLVTSGSPSFFGQPKIALLRSGPYRIVLLRKLIHTPGENGERVSLMDDTWFLPSQFSGGRWKNPEVAPNELAPPIILHGYHLGDLALGRVSLDLFDSFFDSAPPWDWKAVENLAESKGLTAKEVAAMIRSRKSRGKS